MKKEKKKRKIWQHILLGVINGVLTLVLAAAILIGVLFATEYNPADGEKLEVAGTASETVSPGQTIRLVTFNIGYGSLGDNADFFLDGGKGVKTADRERTLKNMEDLQFCSSDHNPVVLEVSLNP